MQTKYYGIYASYIEQFVALKKQLGFKYENEAYFLSLFDKYTVSKGETKLGITKELAEQWLVADTNQSEGYRHRKGNCINQLASFLSKQGIASYIIEVPKYQYSFCPYIFTTEEIKVIFDMCDHLTLQSGHKSIIISIPTIIRLLYATGVRIGEALALKNNDVNLTEGYLVVSDSKNSQQRMIPISSSLSHALRDYVNSRNKIPMQTSDCFFVSLAGTRCKVGDVQRWFKRVLKATNIKRTATGPRLHDLRHTFCVHSLAMMAESGTDLYCSLPVLSRYIGHLSMQSTNGYVRLTASMYPGLLKDVETVCFNIFPKLQLNETN